MLWVEVGIFDMEVVIEVVEKLGGSMFVLGVVVMVVVEDGIVLVFVDGWM